MAPGYGFVIGLHRHLVSLAGRHWVIRCAVISRHLLRGIGSFVVIELGFGLGFLFTN